MFNEFPWVRQKNYTLFFLPAHQIFVDRQGFSVSMEVPWKPRMH